MWIVVHDKKEFQWFYLHGWEKVIYIQYFCLIKSERIGEKIIYK